MLGYIISDKKTINVEEHKIQSFDILHKTDLNIFVVENNVILYKNNITMNAYSHGHFKVLEWFKNSGYEFKYNLKMFKIYHIDLTKKKEYVCLKKASKFLIQYINIKKVIKYTIRLKKTLRLVKFKTKNNYIKGYNKN